jgi:hypothetical protein
MKDVQEVENKEVQETQIGQETPAENQNVELNLNDLVMLRNVVDIASQRGAFRAQELEAVGKVYNKLSAFLEAVSKKEQQ